MTGKNGERPHHKGRDGYCLLLNAIYFSLGFAIIMKGENVFHILVFDDKFVPIFADQYATVDAAKRGFLEKFGGRYLLESEEIQANWSEWHQKEKSND